MNFDIDNFLVQAYAKQFKDLNKSTGKGAIHKLHITNMGVKGQASVIWQVLKI